MNGEFKTQRDACCGMAHIARRIGVGMVDRASFGCSVPGGAASSSQASRPSPERTRRTGHALGATGRFRSPESFA